MNLHPKVAAGGIASAIASLIVGLTSRWVTWTPENAVALTAVVAFVAGWVAPSTAKPVPAPAAPVVVASPPEAAA